MLVVLLLLVATVIVAAGILKGGGGLRSSIRAGPWLLGFPERVTVSERQGVLIGGRAGPSGRDGQEEFCQGREMGNGLWGGSRHAWLSTENAQDSGHPAPSLSPFEAISPQRPCIQTLSLRKLISARDSQTLLGISLRGGCAPLLPAPHSRTLNPVYTEEGAWILRPDGTTHPRAGPSCGCEGAT